MVRSPLASEKQPSPTSLLKTPRVAVNQPLIGMQATAHTRRAITVDYSYITITAEETLRANEICSRRAGNNENNDVKHHYSTGTPWTKVCTP